MPSLYNTIPEPSNSRWAKACCNSLESNSATWEQPYPRKKIRLRSLTVLKTVRTSTAIPLSLCKTRWWWRLSMTIAGPSHWGNRTRSPLHQHQVTTWKSHTRQWKTSTAFRVDIRVGLIRTNPCRHHMAKLLTAFPLLRNLNINQAAAAATIQFLGVTITTFRAQYRDLKK